MTNSKLLANARLALATLSVATALIGCGGEPEQVGSGLDGTTKRDMDRNAMKLERVTKQRDEYMSQVDQLQKQNLDLQSQLRASRLPTTRS